MLSELPSLGRQRGQAVCGQSNQLRRCAADWIGGFRYRERFLQQDMGIRATNAKGADASPSGRLLARPRFQMRIDVKGTALKVDFRIRALVCKEGTKVLCFRHKIALISPAIPAAASRCPILVFTEPIAQNCDRWVV